jgi:DNA polymerase III epsilon subunit-like protein
MSQYLNTIKQAIVGVLQIRSPEMQFHVLDLHRATEDCRFRLLCIVEILRLMLPTPDLRFPPSSLAACCTRCGRGRGRVEVGRLLCATPALN